MRLVTQISHSVLTVQDPLRKREAICIWGRGLAWRDINVRVNALAVRTHDHSSVQLSWSLLAMIKYSVRELYPSRGFVGL